MAKTYVYEIVFKTESDEVVLDTEVPFMTNTHIKGNKVQNIKNLTAVRQFINDFLTEQITPTDPQNPPYPITQIIMQRKAVYSTETT